MEGVGELQYVHICTSDQKIVHASSVVFPLTLHSPCTCHHLALYSQCRQLVHQWLCHVLSYLCDMHAKDLCDMHVKDVICM